MDPRPYHYEYRRPRLSNPTYQSVNLYESLFHKGISERYETQNNKFSSSNSSHLFSKALNDSFLNKSSVLVNNPKQTQPVSEKQGKIKQLPLLNKMNPQQARPYSNRSDLYKNNSSLPKSSILAGYGRNSFSDQISSERQFKQQNMKQFKLQNDNIFKRQSVNHLMQQKQKPFKQSSYDHLNRFSIYQKQQKPYNIIGNYPRQTSTQLRKYPKMTLQNKLIQTGRYMNY